MGKKEELHDVGLENKIHSGLLLAGGQILDGLENLVINSNEFKSIATVLGNAVSQFDILLLFILGFIILPVSRYIIFPIFKPLVRMEWEHSWLSFLINTIAQATRLGLLVYAIDCLVIVLSFGMHFDADYLRALALGFTKIVYITWAAYRISIIKNNIFDSAIARAPKLFLVNRLVDLVIYSLTALVLMDIMDVEMGVSGLTSVFALGSMSTLMVGLATKDIAEMFVSGLTMSTSDRFNVGDAVQFGDNTSGIVEDIGWMQTKIREYDETEVVIPNGQLGMQRVHNLSRIKRCRVKQELRFRYEDAGKIPNLLPDILKEIQNLCPESITDGSRPWRALWTGYGDYYLPVTVDVHFDLPPIGQAYWDNRQKVMEAIYRVVTRHGVRFASSVLYESTTSNAADEKMPGMKKRNSKLF